MTPASLSPFLFSTCNVSVALLLSSEYMVHAYSKQVHAASKYTLHTRLGGYDGPSCPPGRFPVPGVFALTRASIKGPAPLSASVVEGLSVLRRFLFETRAGWPPNHWVVRPRVGRRDLGCHLQGVTRLGIWYQEMPPCSPSRPVRFPSGGITPFMVRLHG